MNYSIYEYTQEECDGFTKELEQFELYWANWDEALIRRCWLATDDDQNIIGFLTANWDRETIAVEVLEQYRGQGIGTALVEESRCYTPEDNCNPAFWAKFESED